MLLEVKAAVNCCPLTPVSDDSSEIRALTPSDFLIGKRTVSLPLKTECTMPTSAAPGLRRCAKHREETVRRLWSRWKKEYLLLLRSEHHGTSTLPSRLRVGDLVVVQDDNVAPLRWKVVRVVQSFPERDGMQWYHEILLPGGQRI